jgi:hypothetical protein
MGSLTEFLWRTMATLQDRAMDSPMAPDADRKSAYSNHLCTLLSMAVVVAFENITLVVSPIYPTTTDITEHTDIMNDSIAGYTRTGVLNMCFMLDRDQSHKLGLQFQVIGSFRRVIREYMVRHRQEEISNSPEEHQQEKMVQEEDVPMAASPGEHVHYETNVLELRDMAYNFGVTLRRQNDEQAHPITFEGRQSKRSEGGQSYDNGYSPSNFGYSAYRFKAAVFCDKQYASSQNIQRMKVLGHLERPRHVETQVNSFDNFESGRRLLDYLTQTYGTNPSLQAMRSATYHQQVTSDDGAKLTIFQGHVDKSFVHSVWFVPLASGIFFTFVAVPGAWNVPFDPLSEQIYREWVLDLKEGDQRVLGAFQETFDEQAKAFMKVSSIRVLIYHCTLGTFLSFPANQCFHATVSMERKGEMKDLLIIYPMERG